MKFQMQPGVEYPNTIEIIRNNILVVPDFPKTGVDYLDITPVFASPKLNSLACQALNDLYDSGDYDAIAALEARAWPFAQYMSLTLNKPWFPIRKPNKLPRRVVRQEYACEYGTGVLEMHADDVTESSRVLLVDDVVATGGSLLAAAKLVAQTGATVVATATILSLDYLLNPELTESYEMRSVVHYTEPPQPISL